jgi:hypothetical protein
VLKCLVFLSALRIQETQKSTNADDVGKAMQEHPDMIEAKQDLEYFLFLLDLAIHHSLTNSSAH